MIPCEFEYYQPDSYEEAVSTFQALAGQGKNPVYYAGGTEVITFARAGQLQTGAVIDLKAIPQCNALQYQDGTLVVGAAVTQTRVVEENPFPLLSETTRRAADHTSRNSITVGGNICGVIPYRESVLPFLLADSQAVIAGQDGLRKVPLREVFDREMQLGYGEFLVQVLTDKSYAAMPYVSTKKTRMGKVDYPLVTVAGMKKDGWVRAAFSGVCAFPFRSAMVEEELNRPGIPLSSRIDQAVNYLPGPITGDILGSAEYREFVLRNALQDVMDVMEGVP